jgi:nitroreductase
MELMEIIQTRRSTRRFQAKEVPEEVLDRVFEAVRWAPSWNNTQCWEIIAVRTEARKRELLECVPKYNPGYKAIAEVPVILILCGKLRVSGYYQQADTTKFGDWFMFDLGLAAQNACLMAHAQGLGTLIVGLFDHDKAKGVLGVPQGYEVVAIIPCGYPAQHPKVPGRKDLSEFVHEETFS